MQNRQRRIRETFYKKNIQLSSKPIRYDVTKLKDDLLYRVQKDYEEFNKTQTFKFPTWLYGPQKGKLFKVKVEDCPQFGNSAYLEIDSSRTAFISIDMQIDFCGKNGYVDVMGYDLGLTSAPIKPIKNVLDTIRNKTDIKVIHTREGHLPDLSDAPYNKILRSKIIGKGIGIGNTPQGGLGRLLVRGEPNWDIVDDLYPIPTEVVIDKAGKGAFGQSNLPLILRNLGITSCNRRNNCRCMRSYNNERS